MIGTLVSVIVAALVILWIAEFSLLVIGLLVFGALLSVGQTWATILAVVLAVLAIASTADR